MFQLVNYISMQDDTTAFVTGDTIDQVSQLLNVLLADICSWCELNRLTIHP